MHTVSGNIKDHVYPNANVRKIMTVRFQVLENETTVSQAVAEITSGRLSDKPESGTLRDPKLGCLSAFDKNSLTNLPHILDPGNFGYVELALPVIQFFYSKPVLSTLKCTCFNCCRVLVFDNASDILKVDEPLRMAYIQDHFGAKPYCNRCNQPVLKYKYSTHRPLTIEASHSNPKIMLKDQKFERDVVYEIFRNIPDEDLKYLGLHVNPSNFFCTKLPIPPPTMRPAKMQDNGRIADDDITHVLADIIKYNDQLKAAIKESNEDPVAKNLDKVRSMWDELQRKVAVLASNKGTSTIPIHKAVRSKQAYVTVAGHVNGKTGIFRENLNGKRVDNSARTVITGDPTISLDEIGTPLAIAMNLTYPETVTMSNVEYLTTMVRNGYNRYPGAKKVVRITYTITGKILKKATSLKKMTRGTLAEIVLHCGDVVYRHLIDGDFVVFNRQPTLHRGSMMAHRVKVLNEGLSFRMNAASAAPYNADFDGDEMNIHLPISIVSRFEIATIMHVPKMMVSVQNANPIIGLVQDSVVGAYLMFKNTLANNEFLTPAQFYQIYTRTKEIVPIRSGVTHATALINAAVPNGFIYNENGVVLTADGLSNTTVISGKPLFGASDGGFIHRIWTHFGPQMAMVFCNNMIQLVNEFLRLYGFTCGIKDTIIPQAVKDINKKAIDEMIKRADEIAHNFKTGNYVNDSAGVVLPQKYLTKPFIFANRKKQMEMILIKMFNERLNKVRADVIAHVSGNINGADYLTKNYSMVEMIISGAKGDKENLAQIMSFLGQVDYNGGRVPDYLTNRPMFACTKYTTDVHDRGLICNCFIDGLTPLETLWHALAARVQVISRSIKTAETGYFHHKYIKFLEDLRLCYDHTIRNGSNRVVSATSIFIMTKCTKVEFKILQMSDADFEARFGTNIDRDQLREDREVLKQKFAKRLIVPSFFWMPCDFAEMLRKFRGNEQVPDDVLRVNVGKVSKFCTEYIYSPIHIVNAVLSPVYSACIRGYLNSDSLKYISEGNMSNIIKLLWYKFNMAKAEAGEAVGIITAQTVGERTAQNALNAFQNAGIGSKLTLSAGLPRIHELSDAKVDIASPSCTIMFPRPDSYEQDKANYFRLPETKDNTARKDFIKDYKTRCNTLATRILCNTEEVTFKKVLLTKGQFKFGVVDERVQQIVERYNISQAFCANKWVYAFSLDKGKLYKYNVNIQNMIKQIRKSVENARILVSPPLESRCYVVIIVGDLSYSKADATFFDIYNTYISGIRGLADSDVHTEDITSNGLIMPTGEVLSQSKDPLYGIIPTIGTQGSNLLEILSNPYIDKRETISNDIIEIAQTLGIEAARTRLVSELDTCGTSMKSSIGRQHYDLIAANMCVTGTIVSINRYGMAKSDFSPLAKASFEMPIPILTKACVHNEVDNMQGVSSNVVFGQRPPIGTSHFDVVYLPTESKATPNVVKVRHEVYHPSETNFRPYKLWPPQFVPF